MGYVNKAEPPEKVLEAIFPRLGEGEVYLSVEMTRRLLKGVAGKADTSTKHDRSPHRS